MIIFKDSNGNTLEVACTNTLLEYENNVYIVELPTVICNNRKLAEQIQEETNSFVSNLSKKLLKK